MKYFQYEEFKCKCGKCGSDGREMSQQFLMMLEMLRSACNFPLIISSGYRCPEYNQRVSSTGLTGPHTTGKACDIFIEGEKAYRLVELAYNAGFKGMGVNQKGASRFIHLDILTAKEAPRPRIWSY